MLYSETFKDFGVSVNIWVMRFRCRVLYIESGDVHRINLQQLHISFFLKYRLRSRGHKDHGRQSIRFLSVTFNLIDMKIALRLKL